MLYHDTVVLVFAKAPVEGEVNTRLIPDIGVQAATQLQYDLLHQRLLMLSTANLCAVTLMCAPDKNHASFVSCEQKYPITLSAQSGADLGERLLNGIATALAKYKFCIVIGTDAPALDETMIKQAIDTLHAGKAVVFVPAEDGGYVLVGMGQRHDYLFQDISWGSDQVMRQSSDVLEKHGIPYQAFASCWDVDRLEDYQRYLTLK